MRVGAGQGAAGDVGGGGLPQYSVVVPLFNEADNLPRLIGAFTDSFATAETELVLVDDGSTDGTPELLADLTGALPRSRILRFAANRGKGAAVRAGMLAATGQVRMFMDADLATDLAAVTPLLDGLGSADAAIGSRSVAGSRVAGAVPMRVVMGWSYSLIGRTVGGSGVRDSQCGFKAFRGEVADVVFRLSRVDGFAFDVEVLRLLRVLGCQVVEVPVTWSAGTSSSVRPVRDSARTLVDTVRIRRHLNRKVVLTRARALGWNPSAEPLDGFPPGRPEPLGAE